MKLEQSEKRLVRAGFRLASVPRIPLRQLFALQAARSINALDRAVLAVASAIMRIEAFMMLGTQGLVGF
jgi:hypothetical protein